jgi:arabinan endo-1,5-alpha-L-arabinosidase
VRKVGDYYYLYYSVSTFGSQSSAIGLARSSTMDYGTWTDLGSAGITSSSSKPYNAIDPNLIQVGSSYYMMFGSYWKGIYQAQMKSTPTAASGSATQMVYSSDGEVVEGAYMFKYGSYYYLFYSKGQCCGYDSSKPASGKEYRVLVCRSTSATSGFVDKSGTSCASGGGTAVLESHGYVYGPGGQGVYQDPTYGPVLYYHYGKVLTPECVRRLRPIADVCVFVLDVCNFQSTRALATPTVTRSSAGTRLTSRAAGPSCNWTRRSVARTAVVDFVLVDAIGQLVL